MSYCALVAWLTKVISSVIFFNKVLFINFGVFAGCSVVGLVFILLEVKETKGKNYLEIIDLYKKNSEIQMNAVEEEENKPLI